MIADNLGLVLPQGQMRRGLRPKRTCSTSYPYRAAALSPAGSPQRAPGRVPLGQNGSGEPGVGSKTPVESLAPLLVVDGHQWKAISPDVAVTCGVRKRDQGFC
jgi:hypothetical protein